jgi:hypothetical protein
LNENSTGTNIDLIKNFKKNALTGLNFIDKDTGYLIQISGVSNSVMLYFINKKTFGYATNKTPTAL